jgi:prevent-host-death family protein
MITKTSAEAQNQFGRLLDLVQREPVAITRHGRPAAFIVSPLDMEELLEGRETRRKLVAAEFKALNERALKSTKPAAARLTDEEVNRIVHEVRDEMAREALDQKAKSRRK